MAPESLLTLYAVLTGLHTLVNTAESIENAELRQRMTGTIVGLRAAILNVREHVQQLQQQYDQLLTLYPQATDERAPVLRPRPPRMKWGCYQFDDTEGLFCAACYDKKGRKVRVTRVNSLTMVCPMCRNSTPTR